MNKAAPDLDSECPEPIDEATREDIAHALSLRHQDALKADEEISVQARQGANAAVITALVGPPRRPHAFTIFARDVPGDGFDGALGLVLDYLDGVLLEYFENDREGFLPLDFEGRPFEDTHVFVKSDVRDLRAEALADALLAEQAAKR